MMMYKSYQNRTPKPFSDKDFILFKCFYGKELINPFHLKHKHFNAFHDKAFNNNTLSIKWFIEWEYKSLSWLFSPASKVVFLESGFYTYHYAVKSLIWRTDTVTKWEYNTLFPFGLPTNAQDYHKWLSYVGWLRKEYVKKHFASYLKNDIFIQKHVDTIKSEMDALYKLGVTKRQIEGLLNE